MPRSRPPADATCSPAPAAVPAGTRLWRVHRRHRPADGFNPVRADAHFGGGRFDSTSGDPYPYLYAALDQETALLETLVRGIPFDDHGHRLIHRRSVHQYQVSALRVERELTVVSLLTGEELAAACQDAWLVHAGADDYPQTRRWSQWLRSQAPWAQGFRWPSQRNVGHQALILFGDRGLDGALSPEPGTAVDLDDRAGAAWLNRRLAPYRIQIRPPVARVARPVS